MTMSGELVKPFATAVGASAGLNTDCRVYGGPYEVAGYIAGHKCEATGEEWSTDIEEANKRSPVIGMDENGKMARCYYNVGNIPVWSRQVGNNTWVQFKLIKWRES